MSLHSTYSSAHIRALPRSRRVTVYIALLVTLVLWLPHFAAPAAAVGVAEANTESILQPLISIGGGIKTITTVGTTAYLGEGRSFVTLDVSDPTQPRRLASLMMGAPVSDIQVANGIAYVTYRIFENSWITSGLALVDVHDPAHPIILPDFYGTTGQSTSNLSFVTSPSGLVILDMSNIEHPALVGSFSLVDTTSIQIVGNRAYLVGANKLVILDISDPTHPVQIGEYGGMMIPPLPLYVNTVQVIDLLAYLATSSGLQILDVTDPANLTLVGAVTSQPTIGLSISGSRIYTNAPAAPAPGFPSGFLIIDATDPTNPALIGSYTPPHGQIRQFAIEGDRAILAASVDGLLVVNLQDPAHPALISRYATPADPRMFSMAWPLIYIAADSGGMRIVSLQNPAHPIQLGSYITFGDARLIDVADDFVFIANSEGLSIIDVRILEAPTVIAFFPLTGDPQTLRVLTADGLAYIFYTYMGGGLGGEMRIIDIHDRVAPWTMSQSSLPTLTSIIAISNSLAYIATTDNTLQILDLHNPVSPVLRGILPLPGKPIAMQSTGSLVYIATAPGGLLIVDVTHPETPLIRATYPTSDNPGSMVIIGTRAYLSSGNQIHIIDLSNPSAPAPIGIYTLPVFEQWGIQTVQVVGNRMYVSTPPFYIYLMGYFVQTTAVNITDPTAPILLNDLAMLTKDTPQIVGGLAYIKSRDSIGMSQVLVLDISNLSNQIVRDRYSFPYEPNLLVNGPIVFAADGKAGLTIFRVSFKAFLPMIRR